MLRDNMLNLKQHKLIMEFISIVTKIYNYVTDDYNGLYFFVISLVHKLLLFFYRINVHLFFNFLILTTSSSVLLAASNYLPPGAIALFGPL